MIVGHCIQTVKDGDKDVFAGPASDKSILPLVDAGKVGGKTKNPRLHSSSNPRTRPGTCRLRRPPSPKECRPERTCLQDGVARGNGPPVRSTEVS